ncbi:MAG: hypothetical protein JRF59_03210 [Deltaproteobacteria bacterium]|nr:hypothetical protein [Deltaproteobacteria bacterium]MBW1950727.1 hypothetical protein [Deltaproteobacteria bacterium]MBW2009052.1 hypothetical protein [Deltaproteobacteria bacterium]MBW2346836.1 hypothetical protein [Deltaproteobacteria bacterium]
MIVQIYEIQTPEEAERCVALGVDHVGSVLLSGEEWRVPALREVVRVTEAAGGKSSLIPLFADQETLFRALDFYRPALIHFCESLLDEEGTARSLDGLLEYQSRVKERYPEIGIIRSIPVPESGHRGEAASLQVARELEPVTDFFLADTWLGGEPVAGYIGITGKTADRKIAADLVNSCRIPVILAGGLSPENVYEALLKVVPAGVDSCTGTNVTDPHGSPVRFRKDFDRVARFVREVRRAEAELRDRKKEQEAAIARAREELREREAALPAHSVRPHQLMAVEALEEEISALEHSLRSLQKAIG